MYCVLGLCKALAEKVIQPNGGWIEECDYDLLCSPMGKNEGVHTYAVGFFMPDGKKFLVNSVHSARSTAENRIRYLNGGC